VSIRQLKQIHSATRPARLPKDNPPVKGSSPDAAELFAALDAEAEEDKEVEETL
jgi:integrase/recombinase XerD